MAFVSTIADFSGIFLKAVYKNEMVTTAPQSPYCVRSLLRKSVLLLWLPPTCAPFSRTPPKIP